MHLNCKRKKKPQLPCFFLQTSKWIWINPEESLLGLRPTAVQNSDLGGFSSSYWCPHTHWLNDQLRQRVRIEQEDKGWKSYKKRSFGIHLGWKEPAGRVTEYMKELWSKVTFLKSYKSICTSFLSAHPKPGRPWIPSLILWYWSTSNTTCL